MIAKTAQRIEAIKLRRQGLSYSEIRKKIQVSKSSLSLWLNTIHLTKLQEERIRLKNNSNWAIGQKLGAKAKIKQRIGKVRRIESESIAEIGKINQRELFYMGVMLYWAEGTKSRKGNISQPVDFSNSDPNMCRLFMNWVKLCLKMPQEMILPCVYIHESKKNKIDKVLSYWSDQISFPKEKFGKTCFTKTVYPRKRKRKEHAHYNGQLRIKIRKSTDLNRKIAGWTRGIYLQGGVGQ